MDEYWMVNVRRFGRHNEVVAFGPDHAAAVRFAHDQEAAGNRAVFWNMMAGHPSREDMGDRR